MSNRKVIIAIILGIGAVISLIYGISAPVNGGKTAQSTQKTLSANEVVSPPRRIMPSKRSAAKTNFNFWGKSPFVLEMAPAKTGAGLVLNGIMWDEKRPLVIINNDVIGIGGKVGENTVVDIKKDSVILTDGAGNFELRLAQ